MRGEHLNEDPIGFLDEPPIQGGFYFHNTALDFLTHTRLFCKQQRGNMRRTALCLLVILGFSVSLVQADYQSGIKAFNSGDFEMAFKEFLAEAQKGNADAQNDVGAMYNLGQGVSQDHAKAVQWFRKAAEQGHPEQPWEELSEGPGCSSGLQQGDTMVRKGRGARKCPGPI
jgi:TPR repeat protein